MCCALDMSFMTSVVATAVSVGAPALPSQMQLDYQHRGLAMFAHFSMCARPS